MCHRYGDEAAELSKHSFGMVVDAYDVYGAYKRLQHRALAKAFFKGSVRPGTADNVAINDATAGADAGEDADAGAAMPGTGAATAGTPPTGTESYHTPPTANEAGKPLPANASAPKASGSNPPPMQTNARSGKPVQAQAQAQASTSAGADGANRAMEYRSAVYVPPNNPYRYKSYNELDGEESIELLSPLPPSHYGAQPAQQYAAPPSAPPLQPQQYAPQA